VNASLPRAGVRVAVAACALPFAVATVTPASAHIDVSAQNPQAGTGPVTVVFSAESESSSAGITGVATQLPAGIPAADVALASGPAGWVLTPTASGFEIAGPDLGPGVDVEYSVTIARLPGDTTDLAFPTLQRYADGREDAWIEPVTEAVPDPNNPAPVLTVAPAPPEASSAPTSSAAPLTQESPAATDALQDTTDAVAQESNTGTIALVVGIVVVAAVGVAGSVWRSRRAQ
jgi:hypothetical protein